MDDFQKQKLRIPSATYRLQLNASFTFQQATELVDYLYDLGVSHIYCSPILAAHSGSHHGYDVIDHSRLNPELGTEEDFIQFVKAARKKNMGILIDIVPNHMFIFDALNLWWFNVLENGPSSPYADYFDIDWSPPRSELENKVLLPILDSQYGEALENQKLKVVYSEGTFYIEFFDHQLPTDPSTWVQILKSVVNEEDLSTEQLELASIVTALGHLPVTTEKQPEKIKERQREKEIIKQRLKKVVEANPTVRDRLSKALEKINGIKGTSTSFDALENFINTQPYRLCFWRVANNEINYRRFFDVCALAGIKMEHAEVFDAAHAKIFDLINKNLIDGLRIDHIDGLIDPRGYLNRLQRGIAASLEGVQLLGKENLFYVVAEKILMGNEQSREDWKLHGTVGYDFLNDVNGLFINQKNKPKLLETYFNFTGTRVRLPDLFYECKKLILLVSMSGEHYVLVRILDKISEQHRSSKDYTEISLASALRDVIASFPVYRSYINPLDGQISEEDRNSIMTAINNAKRRSPIIDHSIFNFIKSVLLLEHPPGLTEEQKALRENFVQRIQQLTSAITAKGIEDTAFYRYHPLASLNEVGSTLRKFGITSEEFHRTNSTRNEKWPHTLLCTSTHDTKRSEDARSRLNVLSEIPDEWEKAIKRWHELNQNHKTLFNDCFIPDENDEYLLYQTLIATWPFYPMDPPARLKYQERIQNYMLKSIREAKVYSSWINPNVDYENAMQKFIADILSLDPDNQKFLIDFVSFTEKIQRLGIYNALAMTVLKMTSPGVPDVYQGNELWDFSLVDPDNRHPVDFKHCQHLLKSIKDKKNDNGFVEAIVENAIDGRIKLFVTFKLLNMRRENYAIFTEGEYVPLKVEGKEAEHIVAYSRQLEDKEIIIVAACCVDKLFEAKSWDNTKIFLSEKSEKVYVDIFTGNEYQLEASVEVSALLDILPFTVLVAK